jgi:ketopantoate reductase
MLAVMRVLLVGPGQLGRVIAGGLVACGVSVEPVVRGGPIAPTDAHDLVLVAVGEGDLDAVLAAMPETHRERVVLLQNELVPESWSSHAIVRPTVLVVWFEKKKGRAIQEVLETEIAGPHGPLFVRALAAMDVRARAIDEPALAASLVVKNLYIVGANVLGLALGGTTGELVELHRARTERVLREVLAIELARLGSAVSIDEDDVLARTFGAFQADPRHGTVGRTARERLARALERARAAALPTPELDAIARAHAS